MKEAAELENDIIWEASEIREEEVITEETPQFQNGLIFSTEYDIKDYCDGYFIVSKNDDLLWGILDMNGEEWIPCEYDEISFLNRNGFNENAKVQLIAAYTNEATDSLSESSYGGFYMSALVPEIATYPWNSVQGNFYDF